MQWRAQPQRIWVTPFFLFGQQGVTGHQNAFPAGDVLHHKMGREQRRFRLHRPYVQVVHRGEIKHVGQVHGHGVERPPVAQDRP